MEKKFRWARFILILLTAGALGNLVDRLALDYVVDFFYFELIDFPIFNMADIYVSCGVVLLVLFFLFYYKDEDIERLISFKKLRKKQSDTL